MQTIRALNSARGFTMRANPRWDFEHLLLVKKPDAFQLGSADADDSKVKKTLAQLGLPEAMLSKMPKPFQLVIAQLAFANSDLAFEGNHLFQGNFYGVNIFDISDPAKAKLLTDGLPGRTGRRVGIQKSPVHVGGDAEWAPGLRRRRISAGTRLPPMRQKTKIKIKPIKRRMPINPKTPTKAPMRTKANKTKGTAIFPSPKKTGSAV